MPKWLTQSADGIILHTWIQPGSSKNAVAGIHEDRLKIRIHAAPVEGAANEELLHFLKKKLKTKGIRFELIRGHQSRQKDVLVSGINLQTLISILQITSPEQSNSR